MRILPSRIHVFSVTEDAAFMEGGEDGDWTDALVSVRCKRFNPPLSNAVDLEFARAWIYELKKTPDIFCLNCVVFVHKAQFDVLSAWIAATQPAQVTE